MKRHEEYLSEKMRINQNLTPLSLIDKFLKTQEADLHNRKHGITAPTQSSKLFKIKAVQARIRYQRMKFEKHLKFKVQYNIDMT